MSYTVDPEKFLQIFRNQFEEKSASKISLQSRFQQIEGWSSLQALIITVAVHEEWGVSFSDEDFRNATTVHDLWMITERKLNA
jgi:acyl carrier protein